MMKMFQPKREFRKLVTGGYLVRVTPHAMSGFANASILQLTDDQFHRYEKWMNTRGMLIQEALPELDADTRESLLSGITPEEWRAKV